MRFGIQAAEQRPPGSRPKEAGRRRRSTMAAPTSSCTTRGTATASAVAQSLRDLWEPS